MALWGNIKPEYRKSMNHNYITVEIPEGFKDDYQLQMLAENHIPGILPADIRLCEGKERLYFEVNSMQPLSRIYGQKDMKWQDIRMVLEGITSAFGHLDDYLLDASHVLPDPEYVFVDMDRNRICFLFLPFYEKEEQEGFSLLAEYILEHVDHRDERAAEAAYLLYKKVRRQNFVLEDIRRIPGEVDRKTGAAMEPERGIERNMPEGPERPERGYPGEPEREGKRAGIVSEEFTGNGEMYGRNSEEKPEKKDEKKSGNLTEKNFGNPSEKKSGKKSKNSWAGLILPILILLGSALLASGRVAIPGMREAVITGYAGIVVGAAMLSFKLFRKGKKKEAVTEESDPYDDLFKGMEKKSETRTSLLYGDDDEVRDEEETEYGKTVFMEEQVIPPEEILKEKGRNKEYPIRHYPFTIGKVKDCVDLPLKDGSVSRIHARILKEGGKLYLQDCHSTNGTFLNGLMLEAEERVAIERDDEIGIGRVRFQLL